MTPDSGRCDRALMITLCGSLRRTLKNIDYNLGTYAAHGLLASVITPLQGTSPCDPTERTGPYHDFTVTLALGRTYTSKTHKLEQSSAIGNVGGHDFCVERSVFADTNDRKKTRSAVFVMPQSQCRSEIKVRVWGTKHMAVECLWDRILRKMLPGSIAVIGEGGLARKNYR